MKSSLLGFIFLVAGITLAVWGVYILPAGGILFAAIGIFIFVLSRKSQKKEGSIEPAQVVRA